MRRSVRAYTAQTLDEPTIRALLDAAVQAPTATHSEPWAFVVVQDRAALKLISDRAKGSWVKKPHTTAICTRMLTRRCRPPSPSDSRARISACSTTPARCRNRRQAARTVRRRRLLAGRGESDARGARPGLGTCRIGSAVPVLNSPDTKSELGIPFDVEIVAPIIAGVPREPAEVSRRNPTIVSWTRSQ